MARFASNQQSEGLTLGVLADQLNAATQRAYNALTGASPTLTAAQTVNAIVKVSGQTAAQTVTTPTAAAIVALLPNAQVGSMFEFTLINAHTSTGTVTLAGGSGVTLSSISNDVAITKSQIYRGVVTNATSGAEAVTLYGLLSAGA